MSANRVQIPLRLDVEIKVKIQYIADNNFRPINKEIERLIIQYITQYEAKNGPIPLHKMGFD